MRDLKDYAKSKMVDLKIDGNEIKGLRPAQEDILEKFVEALNQDKHLLIQTPNGCGKTLAYSLVVGYITEKCNGRALIVCPTKDLQKQVLATCRGLNLDFIELYGSVEYTCPVRNELSKKIETPVKKAPVITLLCKHMGECPYLKNNECDYYRSKKLAEESALVITNYDKYFLSWGALTKKRKFDLIIFDEAHNLESIAEESSRVHTSLEEIERTREDFQKYLEMNYSKIEELVLMLENLFSFNVKLDKSSTAKAENCFRELIKLFYERRFNIERDIELTEKDLNQFASKCKQLADALEFFSIVETFLVARPENMKLIKLRTNLIKFTLAALRSKDRYMFLGRVKRGRPEIVGEPQIRGMIKYALKQSTVTQCHVSATLGNLFDYAEQIGALKPGFVSCEITDYPFDAKRRILFGLTDGPIMKKFKNGKRDDWWEKKKEIANRILEKLLLKWPGNVLIFFRSRGEAADAYDFLSRNFQLEPRLKFRKYFETGAERKEFIDRFKREKGSILLGFGKMEQGLDLPGESLTLILLYSMPFIRRTKQMWKDLLYFGNRYNSKIAFEKVDLNIAAKRISQLVGRLIRTEDDYGAVVVIDGRFYGRFGPRFYNWMKDRDFLPKDVIFRFVTTDRACEILEKFWGMMNKDFQIKSSGISQVI